MSSRSQDAGRQTDDFPFDGHPSGWYQVAWARDLEPGGVKPLRYFDRDLVLYRTSEGAFHLLDAVCPHLGANIGYGGKVDGDCLVCPFHGWVFDSSGHNVRIPYSEDQRPNRGARLGLWPVVMVGELVFTWYDRGLADGPRWGAPGVEEFDSSSYVCDPEFQRLWPGVVMRPQYAAENVIDAPHQVSVHRSPSPSVLTDYEARDAVFHSSQEILVGAGKEKTWLTPDGPVLGRIRGEAWGLGVLIARYEGTDESVHLHCHTPIDETHVDARLTVLNRQDRLETEEALELARRRFSFEAYQFERDVVIWERLTFKRQPMYTRSEVGPYRTFRAWAEQFYRDPTGEVGTSAESAREYH